MDQPITPFQQDLLDLAHSTAAAGLALLATCAVLVAIIAAVVLVRGVSVR